MKEKVLALIEKLKEVEENLALPSIFENPDLYKKLTKEHAYLSKVKDVWGKLLDLEKIQQQDLVELEKETDIEMRELLEEEINLIKKSISSCSEELQDLLVPPDADDSRNIIMEIRAGTGGEEAALFVGDCVRMYQLFASKKGWKNEILSFNPSDVGGFKEYIMVFSGEGVKRFLQYEAGTHRVQRVPETETQGRVHTSAITIAILLEPNEEEELKIEEKDLRIDTYRASGAGGQHVNVTDSAVRITHIPSGVVVSCQDERSQHKNKDKAMRILKAKIADEEKRKKAEEESALRLAQVGSGDRSERIRTYNYSQNRVSDHRINLTLYNLDKVMQGELDVFVNALVRHFHQIRLHSL